MVLFDVLHVGCVEPFYRDCKLFMYRGILFWMKSLIEYSNWYRKILLSLFVAVILDNLELEEDVKKIKQVTKRWGEFVIHN